MTPTQLSFQLRSARLQRNFFAVLTLGLVIAVAAQSIHMARTTNQVVLTPSQISDGMVARGAVDARYLEALAKDVVLALYQTSPQTLAYGRDTLSRMAAASQRNALLTSFDETARDIERRKISTVFRIKRLETNLDNLTVAVTGQFDTIIRTTPSKSEERTVVVGFARQGASGRIISIEGQGGRS